MVRALAAVTCLVLLACGSAQRPPDGEAEPGAGGDASGAGEDAEGAGADEPSLPVKVVKSSRLTRIEGESQILPDPEDAQAIEQSGQGAVAIMMLCIDATGKVTQVKLFRSSGHPGYDDKIQRTMQEWGYQPVLINGEPSPVCTAITHIYRPDEGGPDPGAGVRQGAPAPPPP
jgi:TonB family protein